MIPVDVDQYDAEMATYQLVDTIEKYKEEISIVWFSMVNYLTSTKYDVEKVAKACHKYGIKCCVDLAHAAGSVPLNLHDWNVDGAAWCTYKYLNAGPGCMGGLFIHKNHLNLMPGLRGWYGNDMNS